MEHRKILRILFVAFAFIMGIANSQANALEIGAVVNDFQPTKGVLVMPLEGQWLIDVDATDGIIPGDLFVVVERGNVILHPITKEVIGNIEETKSVLRINKIKSGYSYANVIKKDGELKPGLEVRRFTGVPTQMVDMTGEGRALYAELQSALSHMEWVGYSTGQSSLSEAHNAALSFKLDNAGLTVADQEGTPIRYYSSRSLGFLKVATSTSGALDPTKAKQTSIVSAQEDVVQSSSSIVRNTAFSQDGLWRSPNFKESAVGVTVADFDGDEQLEVALLTASSIEIVRLSGGEYKQIAHYKVSNSVNPLAIDSADLDGNGRAEIYLTTSRENEISSFVLELSGRSLTEIVKGAPYYIRNTFIPDEGYVLLGQRYGSYESPFKGPVFRLQLQGKNIEAGAALSLPRNTSVFSFISLGDGLVARINLKHLTVSGSMGDVWDGDAVNGASEISIDFKDPNAAHLEEDTLSYFIAPRLAEGGNGVVLATEHKDNLLGHKLQTYSQGRVVAYKWDGNEMKELWHTKPQSGYLADFSYDDADNDGVKEIVAYYTFGRGGFLGLGKGRSAFMVFELH